MLQRFDRCQHALTLDRDVGLESSGIGAQPLSEGLERADLGAQPLAQILGAFASVALGVGEHLGCGALGLGDLGSGILVGGATSAQRIRLGFPAAHCGMALGVGDRRRRLPLGFGEQSGSAGLGLAHGGVRGALGEHERAPQRLVGIPRLAGALLGFLCPSVGVLELLVELLHSARDLLEEGIHLVGVVTPEPLAELDVVEHLGGEFHGAHCTDDPPAHRASRPVPEHRQVCPAA